MPSWKAKKSWPKPGAIVEVLGGLRNATMQLVADVVDGNMGEAYQFPTDDLRTHFEPELPPVDASGIDSKVIKPRTDPANPLGPPVLDEVDTERTPAMLALRNIEIKLIEHRAVLDMIQIGVNRILAAGRPGSLASSAPPPPADAPAPPAPPPPPAPAPSSGQDTPPGKP